LGTRREKFLIEYERRFDEFTSLARTLEALVAERLSNRNYDVHLVSARAKSLKSLTTKVLLKDYADPQAQVTDLIGVRIITFYGSQVDPIIERLKPLLTVDASNSLDKRRLLEANQTFGYRSVHLVGRLRPKVLKSSEAFKPLKGVKFEVQVRSVLDHAWAEVEHELVYKAGTHHEPSIRRRFAAVAGAFEILESELLGLKIEVDARIDFCMQEYSADRGLDEPLDGARLIGLLEHIQPDGLGWRKAERVGTVSDLESRLCVRALQQAGLVSGRQLRRAFKKPSHQTKVETFASLSGCSFDEVSHFALVALLVADKDQALLVKYFPQLAESSAIKGSL